MTDPHSAPDLILAAREIVKRQNNPAHWSAIDRGEWDPWGAIEAAKVEALKKRAEQPDALESGD